jgi:V/A-type H+-transporting ATPase subunit C
MESVRKVSEKDFNLDYFDRLADDFVLDYVRGAKLISIGIEPLVGYMMAKENEVKIVRIILAGKLAGLSSETIRKRLRQSYV